MIHSPPFRSPRGDAKSRRVQPLPEAAAAVAPSPDDGYEDMDLSATSASSCVVDRSELFEIFGEVHDEPTDPGQKVPTSPALLMGWLTDDPIVPCCLSGASMNAVPCCLWPSCCQGFDFPMENEKILEKMRNFSIFHIFHMGDQIIFFYATFPVAPAVCCRL